jgi:hypothetical protein
LAAISCRIFPAFSSIGLATEKKGCPDPEKRIGREG